MNMNKHIIFTLLLSTFLCIGYHSQAQQKGKKGHPTAKGQGNKGKNLSPEEKATKVSERLEKKLTLDATQKTKVYELTLAHITKVKGLRESEAKGKGEAFKAARTEYNTNLMAILTPTQLQEWEKLKAEAKARRAERGKKDGPKPETTEEPELDVDVED